MRKIPCVFERVDGQVIDTMVNPRCQWVLDGEGVATRKWDGTACMVKSGILYKRYDCKRGKVPPVGFKACDPEGDPVTGHWPGWVKVSPTAPEDWMHRDALQSALATRVAMEDGTYELIGPRINRNPEGVTRAVFVRHGDELLLDDLDARAWGGRRRSFLYLRDLIGSRPYEGVVFHHPDGRMAKLRRSDYLMPYPVAPAWAAPASGWAS